MRYIYTIIVGFILSFLHVSAQTSIDLEFPSFLEEEDPAGLINNFYLYILGIAGTLAVIMIVYGGVKYIVTAGNISSQSDAKDIIKNSIFGLILLAGAFLILNTINPSLVVLDGLKLSTVGVPDEPGPGAGSEICDGFLHGDSSLASFAEEVRSSINLSTSATCRSGSDPATIVDDIASGIYGYVCKSGCFEEPLLCKRGGLRYFEDGSSDMCGGTPVVVDKVLFNVLMNVRRQTQNTSGTVDVNLGSTTVTVNRASLGNFTITSLTGGEHEQNSTHYRGRAADIVPDASFNSSLSLDEKVAIWKWYKDTIASTNMAGARGEFDIRGDWYEDPYEMFDANGNKKSGAHIHVQIN